MSNELERLLDRYSEGLRRNMDAVWDALRPRSMRWRDVSAAIESAAPLFAKEWSPTSAKRRVAEDFLLRFKDHADRLGDEEYDGAPFTLRSNSLAELFAHELHFLKTDLVRIEADQDEKERVGGTLGSILSSFRKIPFVLARHGTQEYVVFLSIPDVEGGRGSHPYTASMRVQRGRMFNESDRLLALERRTFYSVFARHWFTHAFAWGLVGDDFAAWLGAALEKYDAERVVFLLTELMRTLQRRERVLFLNGLSGFNVHPLVVREETFGADYVLTAWANCGAAIMRTDADTESILCKLRDHEALDVVEKTIALRILQMCGPTEFASLQPVPRNPTVPPEHQEMIEGLSAEGIIGQRLDLHEWFRDAQKWLEEEGKK